MMNIEQITSRLPQMSDEALQKYAMMNREDPYIIALALSESRRRKQMRAAAAAPQPQARPKVADQALMEMASAGGVDALPTQDMNFAGGGIVAFADGGDVERYQVGGSTGGSFFSQLDQQKAAQLAQLNAQLEQINPLLIAASRSGNPQEIQQYSQQAQAIRNQINAVRESAGNRIGGIEQLMAPAQAPAAAPVSTPTPSAAAAPVATPTAPRVAPDVSRTMLNRVEQSARTDPAVYGAPAKADSKEKGGLGSTPEAEAMRKLTGPAVPAAKAPSVQSAKDIAAQIFNPSEALSAAKEYVDKEEADIKAARKRREEGKPGGQAYSKYEEMLQAEGAKSGKERSDAVSTAILQFGVGLMGGTSSNAFKNISDAAGPALGQYTSALKDLKKADKERQKAFADIENARRAEAREDWKSAEAFEEKASTRLSNARKYWIDFGKDVTGKESDIVAKIYDRQVAEKGDIDRARIQAQASAAARPFDIDGEYAKAVLAGDKERAASLLEVIQNRAAARKPGLDETQLNAFTKANEKAFEDLRLEKNKAATNPTKYGTQYQTMLSNLRRAAEARGLDPDSIPDLATGGSKVDSSLLNRADKIVGG